MQLSTTIKDLQKALSKERSAGKSIGFVPTMGALHQGHLELVKRSVLENDVSVVSIFVNPTQFNDVNDLLKYPRTLEADCDLLRSVDCTYVFAPEPDEIYPEPDTRSFDFGGLVTGMEGRFRPGHFNGVAQVVSRLFDIVKPDQAYFGEKDFQQLVIIRQLVEQMKSDISIIACPVVREQNGLAMSSRNQLLSFAKRNTASKVYGIINKSKTLGTSNVKKINDFVINEVKKLEPITLDYFTIINEATLQPVESLDNAKNIVACVAFTVGGIRLIDMIKFK